MNTFTHRLLPFALTLVAVCGAHAQPPGMGGGKPSAEMMQTLMGQMDAGRAKSLRKTLAGLGYKDKVIQDAIIVYANERAHSQLPLKMAFIGLSEMARNKNASAEEVRAALARFRAIVGALRARSGGSSVHQSESSVHPSESPAHVDEPPAQLDEMLAEAGKSQARLGAARAELERQTNLANNPRLEAVLTLMGLIGDEAQFISGPAPGFGDNDIGKLPEMPFGGGMGGGG